MKGKHRCALSSLKKRFGLLPASSVALLLVARRSLLVGRWSSVVGRRSLLVGRCSLLVGRLSLVVDVHPLSPRSVPHRIRTTMTGTAMNQPFP